MKLLRALQERVISKVGDNKTIKVDVRVITASNDDLLNEVKENNFREDLYHRINGFKINLPPLRERNEDIMEFVYKFIRNANREFDKTVEGIDKEVHKIFMNYYWYGNIRELENSIEHAFILCADQQIEPHCLPENLSPIEHPLSKNKIDSRLKSLEIQTILEALKRNRYNRLAAARDLGIHKSTLFRKIKELRIDLPEFDGRSKNRIPD